ncbi:hypothetical protein SDC9_106476 [bioreactor metagenome]|uniref:N-acetyltransferase domain-containing protein n=1 Tax=bioreactor metagenome TaxID=1076179 RepID=A0A645B2E8_9ZZZZ|nr:GNAT family N-acetyltransferase [Oscillospiraceae bacterium]
MLIWRKYDTYNGEVESWLKDYAVKRFLNIDCFWDYYSAIISGVNDIYDSQGNLELGYIQGKNYFVYLIYDDDLPVGLIEIYNPLCICTVIIAPEHRNKGVGEAVLRELITHTPNYIPNPEGQLSAVIENSNIASIKLFTKVGFIEKNEVDRDNKCYILRK